MILVVDDQEIIRRAVCRFLLEAHQEICGEASNGAEAIEKAVLLKPTLILLDVQMPILNGFEATHKILERQPDALILIMSFHNHSYFIEGARKCGARGFIAKHNIARHLSEAVETVLACREYFPQTTYDLH